jgi:aryl-alcohol dehydrogenase-like predicted oxidoreductase
MKYRRLGNTGLAISEVCLGTVQLGKNHGFPGTDYYKRPDVKSAIRLLRRAVDLGISLFDTHRDHGAIEEIIGNALAVTTDCPHNSYHPPKEDLENGKLQS